MTTGHLLSGRLIHYGSTAVTFCSCGLAFAAPTSTEADEEWRAHGKDVDG